MKRLIQMMMIIGAIVGLCSCTGQQTSQTTSDSIPDHQLSKNDIHKMSAYYLDGEVEVDGLKYQYEIAFDNDTQQPVVTTEEGYQYYDNVVRLIISRGTATIYEHTFTKASFEQLVPAADYQRSVLAGFNFNYMQQDRHDRFYFIAVIGDPDETSDINYSVGLAIDKDGHVSKSIVHSVDTEPMTNGLNQDPNENDA